MGKRIASDQPQPSAKQQKKGDWNDGDVSCTNEAVDEGISKARTFKGVNDRKRSLEDIKLQIQNTELHNFDGMDFFYYTGFKKALTTLLSQVHQRNVQYSALLIHGVPEVGKSSLAQNLAYHLASGGSTATLVEMDNSKIFSPDHVTRNICEYMNDEQTEWLIFDQCNVNCLDEVKFKQRLRGSGKEIPIVMFTSGDYEPPCSSWTDDSDFCFKVIDLQVDEAGVTQVKNYFNNKHLEVTDMLKISAVMGHVLKCIIKTKDQDVVTVPGLQESVYEMNALSAVLTEKPSVFWILWPEFCKASPEDIAEKNKPGDWKLQPEKVQLLSILLNSERDPQNLGSRLFVNWLHIDGDGRSHENQNDGYFEHTNYFYYFPCLKKLHQIIVNAYTYTPEQMFKKLLEFYHLLNRSNICNRSVEGNLFESLIRLQCQVQSGTKCITTGLGHFSGKILSIAEVDGILTPSNVSDLCITVEQKRKVNSLRQSFWCDLNANSGNQFPGYDFAFIQMENSKYVLFQLFQATVNVASHKTNTMLSVLKEIRKECKSSQFAHQGKVVPYFVCPHREYREIYALISLGESNCDAQVIYMIKFD